MFDVGYWAIRDVWVIVFLRCLKSGVLIHALEDNAYILDIWHFLWLSAQDFPCRTQCFRILRLITYGLQHTHIVWPARCLRLSLSPSPSASVTFNGTNPVRLSLMSHCAWDWQLTGKAVAVKRYLGKMFVVTCMSQGLTYHLSFLLYAIPRWWNTQRCEGSIR